MVNRAHSVPAREISLELRHLRHLLVRLLVLELVLLSLLVLPVEIWVLGALGLVELHLGLTLVEAALSHVVFVVPDFVKMVSQVSQQVRNLSVPKCVLLVVLSAVLEDQAQLDPKSGWVLVLLLVEFIQDCGEVDWVFNNSEIICILLTFK